MEKVLLYDYDELPFTFGSVVYNITLSYFYPSARE